MTAAAIRFYPPAPPRRQLSLWRFFRAMHENTISVWSEAAFTEDFLRGHALLRPFLVVNRPDAIKHVLLDNADNYVKSELARRFIEPGLGRGLITSEGELWRRHRRIMAPAFHARRVDSFVPAIAAAAEAMLDRWRRLPAGATLDIAAEMMRLTLSIIARTMFAVESDDDVAVVGNSVTRYQLAVRPRVFDLLRLPAWWPRPSTRRARAAMAGLNETVNRIIARRRAGAGSEQDLMALLIAARDEQTGAALSDGELRDEVATVLTAGHETTANALAWTWYLLSQEAAVEAKLHAEVDRALGGRAPSHGELPALGYARQVVEEAMRLYPPVPVFERDAIGDDEVTGQPIRRGTTVVISPWVVHRHRKLWRDPDGFDPDRFAPERAAERPRFAYVPFGGGPRVCLGANFAMTEALVVLATVAGRYRLRLVPGHPVEPLGLITLRPRFGLKMTLAPR